MGLVQSDKKTNKARLLFFEAIFGALTGYVCLAAKGHNGTFLETFFKWPKEAAKMSDWINRHMAGNDLYFCPQLLKGKKRAKTSVVSAPCVWADLDKAKPEDITPYPSIVVRTSPHRHHAYWILSENGTPSQVEEASRRIAYSYATQGADRSGWDLTQLLRIPLTYNTKYNEPNGTHPVVKTAEFTGERFTLEPFMTLKVPETESIEDFPDFPKKLAHADPEKVMKKYRQLIDPRVYALYHEQPEEDWSAVLWHLEMLLLEAGVPREDIFVICWHSACNKYRRDNRPPQALWRDVCKAEQTFAASQGFEEDEEEDSELPKLLTDKDRKRIENYRSFIHDYIDWASSLGDAATQYHEVGAFMVLSGLLSGAVRLETSVGTIIPNLWVMILADSTITRKSTTMSTAMGVLRAVNEEAVLATDGSMEGLLTAIAARPGRPGVFWRDEFSGLLEAMRRKDYLAGLAETLTKLYDGEYQKRILRKETLELTKPVLLIFCGGIRSRIFEQLDVEHIVSGFIPRFIFVEADADLRNYKPMGPMTYKQDETRDELIKELGQIGDIYLSDSIIHIAGHEMRAPQIWDAELTERAWKKYNEIELKLVGFGHSHTQKDEYAPAFDRLAKSGLKCAVLLAASRQDPAKEGKVVVDTDDILVAFSFIEKWQVYTANVISNAGRTATERRIEQILRVIATTHGGISRSQLMQVCRLTSREADLILETLAQRGRIRRERKGRGEIIKARKGAPFNAAR